LAVTVHSIVPSGLRIEYSRDTISSPIFAHAFLTQEAALARTAKQSSANPIKDQDPCLYLFYGDEFLIKEQVHDLIAQRLDEELCKTNLILIDGNALDVGALAALVATPSLFGGPRAIVVEQTTIFAARTDQRKIASRVTESWKRGDRKSALRGFAQLVQVSGLEAGDLEQGLDWTNEVLGESAPRDERETLAQVARQYLEAGQHAGARGDDEQLEELISSSFPEETVLIFTATDVDKRKKLFKTMESRAKVVNCATRQDKLGVALDRPFFEERVGQVLKEAGKNIRPEALEKMYARCGKDLRQLNSELTKLIGYVGKREEISGKDVEHIFMDFHEVAFFELNKVVRTGNLAQCLTALHENLQMVSHPLQTLAAIANEFRRLMIARELLFTLFRTSWRPGMTYKEFTPLARQIRQEHPEMAKQGKFKLLAMNDYVLFLLLRDAQRFSMERLIRIMERIHQVDVMLKSTRVGSRSPELIMEDLMLFICQPAAGSPR
jgi:DNA polymerase III subunit delta